MVQMHSQRNKLRMNAKSTPSRRISILSAIIILCFVLICTFYMLVFQSYYLQSFPEPKPREENPSSSLVKNTDHFEQSIGKDTDIKATNQHGLDGKTILTQNDQAGKEEEKVGLVEGNQNVPTPKATIAYAISLTGCPPDGVAPPSLIDGAAVLKHSIHLNSIQNYKHSSSLYDYKMYAIVHPTALSCATPLKADFGYEILVRDTPVAVEDIEGKLLRERVPNNGCCGEKEFIKIWAYTIEEQPIVVHMDVDTIVLNPLDNLYDAMLDDRQENVSENEIQRKVSAMWPEKPLPSQIDAFFTRDYNMVKPGRPHVGVQGGFLVIRSSQSVFDEFVSIIRKGDFRDNGGWGGKGYGNWYGGMTFQGIMPYFYDELHPGTAIELNRCIYNQMADNPRDKRTVNDVVSGKCMDNRDDCEDCRSQPIADVKTAHFTLCQKPWECLSHKQNMIQHRLCRNLFREWYKVRADLELSWQGKTLLDEGDNNIVVGEGTFDPDFFRGFCKKGGKTGYIPIQAP